jgi:hypothetical protein
MNPRITTMVNKSLGQLYLAGLEGMVHRGRQGDYIVPISTPDGIYILMDHTMKVKDCNDDYLIYCETGKALYQDINLGCSESEN